MTDGTGTRTISYNANLQPSGEMFPSAFFGGRILTRTYDSRNRPTGFALGTSSDPAADHAVTYGYDAAGRLATVQGMNRGDRLQSDRGHGLHIDWGVCPGKMSYQWNRNNDLLIWRKAVGLR